MDSSKEYLVIVGSFSVSDNAQSMIDIMEKKGVEANHFKHPNKSLNYVFVYGADDLEDAQNWANTHVPSDIEFWVMHQ